MTSKALAADAVEPLNRNKAKRRRSRSEAAVQAAGVRRAIALAGICEEEHNGGCDPGGHMSAAIESLASAGLISVETDIEDVGYPATVVLYADGSIAAYTDDGQSEHTAVTLRGGQRRAALEAIVSDWHLDFAGLDCQTKIKAILDKEGITHE